jgi:predicted permease
MALFELILPIYTVIFLGFCLKKGGLVDQAFVQVLNQLVYQVFLPVLVFWEIFRAPFHSSFNPRLVLIAYAAMGFIWLVVLLAGKFWGVRRSQVGVPAQGAFRGNPAYIGLAVAFNLYGSPAFRPIPPPRPDFHGFHPLLDLGDWALRWPLFE